MVSYQPFCRFNNSKSAPLRDRKKEIKKYRHPEGYLYFLGAPNRTRTCDTIGQKYGRLTRLERIVILPISFCSSTACICHRQRRHLSQLTAATCLPKHSFKGLSAYFRVKEKHPRCCVSAISLAPQTGLEPVTPRLTAACSTD